MTAIKQAYFMDLWLKHPENSMIAFLLTTMVLNLINYYWLDLVGNVF